MWTIFSACLMVAMGGLIAYLGDLIGRRFGKRRASLFGLRPKHTAVLITSVTGVLISAGTAIGLFLVVPPIRDVILRGEQAIRSNLELRTEAVRLRAEAAAAERSTERVRRASALAIAEANRSISLQQALARELEARNSELALRNGDLRGINIRLTGTNAELRLARARLHRANIEEQRRNSEYVRANEEVGRQNVGLVRENTRLMENMRKMVDQKVSLATEIDGLEKRNAELQRRWTDVTGRNRSLWEMFESLRTRRVVVRGGEDLSRVVVPAHSPPSQVREAISRLMAATDRAARERGAGVGERGRAVQIVDKQFFESTAAGSVQVNVTEEQRIEAVVSRLSWNRESVCIVALALANSTAGEPAAVDLQPLPNNLVYRKGQVVAEREVDGRRPVDELFPEMVSLVRGLGRSALSRGMIPRIDRGSLEPQVGALGVSELVQLAERARSVARPAVVSALATEDVYAADELHIEFKIEPKP